MAEANCSADIKPFFRSISWVDDEIFLDFFHGQRQRPLPLEFRAYAAQSRNGPDAHGPAGLQGAALELLVLGQE